MPKGHSWLRNKVETSKIIVDKFHALFLVFRWHYVEGEIKFGIKITKLLRMSQLLTSAVLSAL